MNRNHDVLWQIILDLIKQPSPSALYCLLAANPAAFTLFSLHGPNPLIRRIGELERTMIMRLQKALVEAQKAQEAAEQAVTIAENAATTVENLIVVAQQTPGASNHPMVTAAKQALVAADDARNDAREARDVAKEVMARSKEVRDAVYQAIAGTEDRVPVPKEVMDRILGDSYVQLRAWRGVKSRLFGLMKEEVDRARREQGLAETRTFINFRRQFFGLNLKRNLRRSSRVKRLKTRKMDQEERKDGVKEHRTAV
ncbi:hypothetical protein K440DRAFT_628937 [Wilcoxina mikolae CBS 423.85]|nr:hypothetical protein K440DRAFT_628937 [Wilcoxina mikolae CBS 423.85]